MKAGLAALLVLLAFQGKDLDDPEHPRIDKSSEEFLQSEPAAIAYMSKSHFEDDVERPVLAASSDKDFKDRVQKINQKLIISDLGMGDPNIEYDVIIQPGHYQRTSGRTGTEGHHVTEQALVAYIADQIAKSLHDTGEKVLVVSADKYHAGLHGKIFIAIHADGSATPCQTGPSLGYKKPTTAIAMNFVALGLADALGYNFKDFRSNFTANEARYYMFDHVKASRLTGLLEVGELTCEKSERDLVLNSHAIGANIARSIDFILNTPSTIAANPGPVLIDSTTPWELSPSYN
jgi:N-acetylmuramoyl-L-alanine amidase